MSSNISITRVCQYCKNEFTARTTKTQCCSLKCSSKAYKFRTRKTKIEESNKETFLKVNKVKEPINDKEFLSVKEASILLNITPKTIYRLIERNDINSFNRVTYLLLFDSIHSVEKRNLFEIEKGTTGSKKIGFKLF